MYTAPETMLATEAIERAERFASLARRRPSKGRTARRRLIHLRHGA